METPIIHPLLKNRVIDALQMELTALAEQQLIHHTAGRQDVINHVTDQATGKEIYNCLKLSQMIEVDKLIKQSRLIND